MKKLLTILAIFSSLILSAQEVSMADEMRSNGKIYVVVGVLLIILIGLLLYLVSIDRKLNKIEKEVEEER